MEVRIVRRAIAILKPPCQAQNQKNDTGSAVLLKQLLSK
jgi:hypothetical protein